MNRKTILDAMYPECPVRNILGRLMDKWSLLVLYNMEQYSGPMRFSALQKAIPDISQKMLATTLISLTDDGIISRKAYAEVPVRVEYALTDRGLALLTHLDVLLNWAIENFADIVTDRTIAKQ